MISSIKAYNQVCKQLRIKPVKITETIPDVIGATTVIVPNTIFSHDILFNLVRGFAGDKYCYINKDFYRQYSSKDLYGGVVSDGYRVVYIPESYNVKSDTAQNQAKTHALDHVPTVFEAVCRWFVLREAGKPLNVDSTYIRHFDLQPKNFGGGQDVPASCVGDGGEAYLDVSIVEFDRRAVVAVGSNLEPLPSPSAIPSSSDLSDNTEAINRLTAVLERIYHV